MGWRQWKVCEVIRRPHKGDMLPNKNLTLGLAFLLVSSATGRVARAQSTYIVKDGDTVGQIATDHGMKIAELVRANGLANSHHLKLGQKLVIPKISRPEKHESSQSTGGYAVRNGDNDWNIAARNGIKPSALRAANPEINWKNLKIGTRLTIPGAQVAAVSHKAAEPVKVAGKYTVRDGDNDWTIASRLGTTPKKIRLANPGVNWTRIRPGDSLAIPSSAGQIVAAGKVTGSKNINSRYAVVTGNSVIIRRAASTTAGRITTVSSGTKVRVLARSGDWYQLRFPMGTEGWVRGDLLAPSKPPRIADVVRRHRSVSASAAAPTKVAKTKRSSHRIHSSPSASDNALVAAEPTTVVARAQTWRGTRYRYGAMSRSATDCSGFTGQVYRSVGVRLPRTSREQATVGQRVSRGSLKPGDLVFFRTSHGNRISHVGIYQGNGKFIHASNPRGGVTVSNLSDGYYANRFVTARRVAKTAPPRKPSNHRVAKASQKDAFPDSVPPLSVTDAK